MFSQQTYVGRREGLIKLLKSASANAPAAGIAILMGNAEASRNYPGNTYAMRQDSTFLYYFGITRHDFAAIVDIDQGSVTLYADDYTVDDIIWMGLQPLVADAAAACGVTASKPMADIAQAVKYATSKQRPVHILPPYRADNAQKLASYLNVAVEKLPSYVSTPLIEAVVAQREIKSDEEIAQIEDACDIAYDMHTTAMRMCLSGVTERQIAGELEGISLKRGAGVSFHPIISQHGETLHNHNHNGVLQKGSLLLVDAGAENVNNYCSDFTRTLPVDGKFTSRQKDIYSIVLKANGVGQANSKAGVKYIDVQIASATVIAQGLTELGLMKGDPYKAVMAGAPAMFMPHGLGHQMGIDVHDMEDLGEKFVGYNRLVERSTVPGLSSLRMGKTLRSGHVITVEPGIYFIPALVEKWAAEKRCAEFINYDVVRDYFGFGGIRIEDDILITKSGSRQLGVKATPKTIEEVEAFMAK